VPSQAVEALKARIIEAVDVDPEQFDRGEYDRLWALWKAQDVKEKPRS
jgi:hypothetical protein